MCPKLWSNDRHHHKDTFYAAGIVNRYNFHRDNAGNVMLAFPKEVAGKRSVYIGTGLNSHERDGVET